MKLFALKDRLDPEKAVLAVLSCYEQGPMYYFDMPEDTDPWTVPFILSSFAARGQWSVDPYWSRRWVESRIVPRERQNLGEVLRVNGLDHYDTLRLLRMTRGENSQDSCYLQPLRASEAPLWFQLRESHRLVEAVPLEAWRLFLAFRTGETRLCDVPVLMEAVPDLERAFDSGAFPHFDIEPGGRGISWGASLRASDQQLWDASEPLGLTWGDFASIAPALLVNATEAADMLGCTRQNLHALARRGGLSPVKSSEKNTLYLRADVRSRLANDTGMRHYATTKLD